MSLIHRHAADGRNFFGWIAPVKKRASGVYAMKATVRISEIHRAAALQLKANPAWLEGSWDEGSEDIAKCR